MSIYPLSERDLEFSITSKDGGSEKCFGQCTIGPIFNNIVYERSQLYILQTSLAVLC